MAQVPGRAGARGGPGRGGHRGRGRALGARAARAGAGLRPLPAWACPSPRAGSVRVAPGAGRGLRMGRLMQRWKWWE